MNNNSKEKKAKPWLSTPRGSALRLLRFKKKKKQYVVHATDCPPSSETIATFLRCFSCCFRCSDGEKHYRNAVLAVCVRACVRALLKKKKIRKKAKKKLVTKPGAPFYVRERERKI